MSYVNSTQRSGHSYNLVLYFLLLVFSILVYMLYLAIRLLKAARVFNKISHHQSSVLLRLFSAANDVLLHNAYTVYTPRQKHTCVDNDMIFLYVAPHRDIMTYTYRQVPQLAGNDHLYNKYGSHCETLESHPDQEIRTPYTVNCRRRWWSRVVGGRDTR